MSGDIQDMKALVGHVATGASLTEAQAETAFDIIMSGDATPAQVGGFLMALRVRGETVAEITGAARAMRAKALKIAAPDGAMDNVGTGGDGSGTYNISTASSFVLAGCGVVVAKHGNRALSSKSGAADVLTHLGVNLDCDMKLVQSALDRVGITFLMAPRHHSAMRHVMGPRTELATRTVLNILGPLSNPASVKRQVIGVFSKDWVVPMAETIAKLGSDRAWVVHGDGLDELTTAGTTFVAKLEEGAVTTFEVTPEDAGLPRATLDELKGGDPAANAVALRAVLGGHTGPYRDIVLLNAAACLVVAEKSTDLKDGVHLAAQSIDSGAALAKLDALAAHTNQEAAA